MNVILKIVLGYVALAGIVKVLKSVESKIKVGVSNFKFTAFTGTSVSYDIDLILTNLVHVEIPVQSMNGYLYYGTIPVGSFSRTSAFSLSPGDNPVSVTGKIDLLSLTPNLVNVITSGEFKDGFYIKGTVNAAGINVSFNRKITLHDFTGQN